MKEFWDNRYEKESYAYGLEANVYFQEQLKKLEVGKILLPAEGEGRNAVFAAKLGWEVTAFDLSKEGKKKAEKLAAVNGVQITYNVAELRETKYPVESFDAIGLIYAHFPPELRTNYHKIVSTYLKKGGVIILEAFSKEHLKFSAVNEKAGGPKNKAMLFSIDEITQDFDHFEILELEEKEVRLDEGDFHVGKSAVIRFVGRKK